MPEPQATGLPPGWRWLDEMPASAVPPPAASPLPDIRRPGPAAGRGTQFDPDKAWRGVDVARTPLARPTGIDAIDGFTSPVGIAGLALGGASIVRAGVAGGAGALLKAGAKEAGGLALAYLKYEGTKTALLKVGFNEHVAEIAAVTVAYGTRGKPKGAAPAAAAADDAALSAGSVKAGSLTQEQIATRAAAVKAGQVPREVVESPIALTRRLKAEQAATAAPTPAPAAPALAPAPAAPASAPTAAADAQAYLKLRASGKTDAQAKDAIAAMRAFNKAYALPSEAEVAADLATDASGATRPGTLPASPAGPAAQSAVPPSPATPARPPSLEKPRLTAPEAKVYVTLRSQGKTDAQAREVILAGRAFAEKFGLTQPTRASTTFPKGNRGGKGPPPS